MVSAPFGALCASLCLAGGLTMAASSVQAADPGELTIESTQLWFVELSSPPTADGGSRATLAAERANFRSQASLVGLNYQVRYTYESLFNGFSVRMDPSDVAKLTRIQGVQHVY